MTRVGYKRRRFVLVLCVFFFCLAMGLRDEFSIWVGTTSAGVASILCILIVDARRVRVMLTHRIIAGVLLGAVAGFAMACATWFLYPLSVEIYPPIEAEVRELYGLLNQPPGPADALPLLCAVVLAEELVWRGLAIDLFSDHNAKWSAMIASALIYVLPQIALGSPLLMAVALMCGVVWGALRVRTGGLMAPLVAHLVWDVLVFIVRPVV